jgi:formylglycine-generating enzyme required for sulfatase activity
MLIALNVKASLMAAALAAPLLATALAPAGPGDIETGTMPIAPAPFEYRVAGYFSRAGKPVEGPLRQIRLDATLRIMRNLVTAAEYSRCVDEGACARARLPDGSPDVPVVGVSWHDAAAYAAWISRRSGVKHRLPTDEEWTFAAAEKVRDEALPMVDPSDPAQAWIARYESEAARTKPGAVAPQPIGTFGTNSNGLTDLAGNVWEWTNTCFVRASLDGDRPEITNTNCGVRVVQGAHRTYMTDFIRDPRTGGCAAGVPPANLGFRLVVETHQTIAGPPALRRANRSLRGVTAPVSHQKRPN